MFCRTIFDTVHFMKLSLTLSLLLLFAGGVVGEETEPKCEEPFVYNEVEGKCVFHETAAFRVFPQEIDKQEVSSRFIQSTILFLPEKKVIKRSGEKITLLSLLIPLNVIPMEEQHFIWL